MSEAAASGMIPPDAGNAPIRRAMTPHARNGMLTFRGTPTPWQGAYGGDLMAHCAAAARHGRSLGRLVSASFEFLRASDPFADVCASTEVVRAGRSITHIRVALGQGGSDKIAAMLVYESEEREAPAPSTADSAAGMPTPWPCDIPAIGEGELAGLPEDFFDYYAHTRGLDVRYITKPPFAAGETKGRRAGAIAESKNWTRVREAADSGRAFSEAALCYIADDSALEPILNTEGFSWLDDEADIVTLSHTMRFAEPADLDGWLLCENSLQFSAGRYVESRGTISTSSGRVVASTQQLGIRVGRT